MVRIVIADDHEILRQGVRRILETHADWEICAEADNGEKAVSLAEQLSPDLIIMDISMPVMSGLEATREISNLDAKHSRAGVHHARIQYDCGIG